MKIETIKNLLKAMKQVGANEAEFIITIDPLSVEMIACGNDGTLRVVINDTEVSRKKIDKEYLVDLHIEAERLNIQKEERARLIKKIQAYLLYTNRGKVDDKLNEFLEDQLR